VSIALSSQEYIFQAGLLILVSLIFDVLDGFSARKLDAVTPFGLQLDSLSDMVSFGIAPLLLILHHIEHRDSFSFWLLPLIILPIWAGAFRLARFNLQPPKQSYHDSLGLTITQSGIILSLTVLSDLFYVDYSLPLGIYIILLLILSYLMISKMRFPISPWYLPSKKFILIYFIIGIGLIPFSSIFASILIISLGSLAISISRNVF
jgi:CDP-diacylglycerol--serine O-phosphatidyltransferase